MCLSVLGQITTIIDPIQRIALVTIAGQPRTISLALLPANEGAVGEWVLVHAGLAIGQVDSADADSILAMLQACDQLDQEEQL